MDTGRLGKHLTLSIACSIAVLTGSAASAHCLVTLLPQLHGLANRLSAGAPVACSNETGHEAGTRPRAAADAEHLARQPEPFRTVPTHGDSNTRIDSPHAETQQFAANRWFVTGGGAGAVGASAVSSHGSDDTEYQSAISRSMNQLPFADSHDWIHNPPEIVREAKNYRRQGVPIIHLMQSRETTVAIGVSNRGKPGLYFVRRLPF